MKLVLSAALLCAMVAGSAQVNQTPPFRREMARITIKRATDLEAGSLVGKAPVKATLEDLLRMTRPEALAQNAGANAESQARRFGPLETTVWQIDVTIKEIVLRADGDFYMVIESAGGSRSVVEFPDPRLCPKSKLIKRIQEVRNQLAKAFHPSTMPQKLDVKATITGVGYFGQPGRTPSGGQNNGARLMPGLSLKISK